MRTGISEEEIVSTAAHRLALHVGYSYPLSIGDVEDILDQSLATPTDFRPNPDDPETYSYCGDRWAADYGSGRPRLVEAIDVGPHPVGPATARVERGFALVIHFVDCVGPPMSDESIDRLRREAWGKRFRRAAEQDAIEVTGPLWESLFGGGDAGEKTGDEEESQDEAR